MNMRRYILTGKDDSVHRVKTLISNRHHRLLQAVWEVKPVTHHGYCLKHMEVYLYQKFKDKGLVNIMWSAP